MPTPSHDEAATRPELRSPSREARRRARAERAHLPPVAAAVCALAALALASPDARAFCRSTTCADAACPRDADGCKTSGRPLFWRTSCVGFSVQQAGTADLPMHAVRDAIARSFEAWSDLACPGGGRATLTFSELADATCPNPAFDPNGPNANVVMFQDDRWTYTSVDDTLARTTVSFDAETGEIWDADIELNSAYNELTVGDGHVVYDLQSLLTHEIGHLVGLDHSLVPDATMNATYDEGSIAQRSLAPDDVAGACAAYPPGRAARCDPTPRGGFDAACPAAPAGGCSSAPGDPRGASPFGALAIAAGLALFGRRRRALAATGVLSAALAAACSAPAPAETLCDPGSVVFCRCPDGEAGSKACGGDGRTFSPCRLETTGALCPDRRGPRSSTSSAGGGGSTAGVAGGGAAGAGAGAGGAAGGSQAGCPGTPLGVAFGADTSVAGDTSAGVDASADRCGGGGAREVVYEVTPAASGTLTATATGVGATDVVLYARAGDCAAGVSLGCVDAASGGGQEVLALEAVAGTSLFLFVDAAPGAGGPFSLDLHLDGGVPGDTCPGVPIAIAPGDVITAGGDTSIATANYKGTGACGASGTKEIVYAVTPSADGTLSVTLTPSFDAQLYARTGSCTSSTAGEQLGCSDAPGAGAVESLALPVAAGAAVSVFADGAAGQAGPYTISFELQ